MPVLSAGRLLSGFKPCAPAAGGGCPTNTPGVFSVNLSAAVGLSGDALGSLSPRGWPGVHAPAPLELFTAPRAADLAGTPQLLAQYPNHDMFGIASLAGGSYLPWINGSENYAGPVHGGFKVKDGTPGQWDLTAPGQRGNAPWLHHASIWKDSHCKLGNVSSGGNGTSMVQMSTDPDAGARCLEDPSRFDKFDVSSGGGMSRFYFYNVLAELDADGEYFVDKPASTLYWKPGPAELQDKAEGLQAVVSVLPSVISAANVTNVTFVGLAVLHGRSNGVEVAGCDGVKFTHCVIANHGEMGVNIMNSSRCSVSHCRVEQTGSGALWLDGGDRDALVPANNTLEMSNVSEVSRWVRFPPGRALGANIHGVGHKVLGNRFDGLPFQNIRVYGNDHLIANNMFRNALWETYDQGVIYSGRDWTILGNVIRGNDISGVHSLYYPRSQHLGDFVKCIHLDDQVSVRASSFSQSL